MAIELFTDNTELDSTTEVELDGEDYNYRIYWNNVYDRWYIDFTDLAGNKILTGKKLTVGSVTAHHDTFPGELVCLSKTDSENPVTLRTLSKDIILVYVPKEEIDHSLDVRGEYSFLDYIESVRPETEEYIIEFIPVSFEFLSDNFEFLDTTDLEFLGFTGFSS